MRTDLSHTIFHPPCAVGGLLFLNGKFCDEIRTMICKYYLHTNRKCIENYIKADKY